MFSVRYSKAYRFSLEHILGGSPAAIRNLPGRFGDHGRESEPVVELVLLQVGEGDNQEAIQI